MEWFGLTLYGFQDCFKDMMRSDYKEPAVSPSFFEAVEKGLLEFNGMCLDSDTINLKRKINRWEIL